MVIADIKDEESLKKMAQRCKVVVNCCGPYRFFGEPVVKACIDARTHHLDVSGEPQVSLIVTINFFHAQKKNK